MAAPPIPSSTRVRYAGRRSGRLHLLFPGNMNGFSASEKQQEGLGDNLLTHLLDLRHLSG